MRNWLSHPAELPWWEAARLQGRVNEALRLHTDVSGLESVEETLPPRRAIITQCTVTKGLKRRESLLWERSRDGDDDDYDDDGDCDSGDNDDDDDGGSDGENGDDDCGDDGDDGDDDVIW